MMLAIFTAVILWSCIAALLFLWRRENARSRIYTSTIDLQQVNRDRMALQSRAERIRRYNRFSGTHLETNKPTKSLNGGKPAMLRGPLDEKEYTILRGPLDERDNAILRGPTNLFGE